MADGPLHDTLSQELFNTGHTIEGAGQPHLAMRSDTNIAHTNKTTKGYKYQWLDKNNKI